MCMCNYTLKLPKCRFIYIRKMSEASSTTISIHVVDCGWIWKSKVHDILIYHVISYIDIEIA